MQRDRLQLVPRIGGKDLRVGEGPMDPLMDGDVLGQYFAVDHKRGHLVLWVYLQVLGQEILPLAEIERPDLEIGPRLGQRDIGRERAGVGAVVKCDSHSRLLIGLMDQLRIWTFPFRGLRLSRPCRRRPTTLRSLHRAVPAFPSSSLGRGSRDGSRWDRESRALAR